jgi:hypothetical protein
MNGLKGLMLALAGVVASCAATGTADSGVDLPDAGLSAKDGGAVDAGRPFDVFDFIPDSGTGAACNACLQANSCGTVINACVNNRPCVAGLGCTASRCFLNLPEADGGRIEAGWRRADGGIETFGCALSCFDGNVVVTLQALGAAACGVGCANTCAGDFLGPIFGNRADAGRRVDAGP